MLKPPNQDLTSFRPVSCRMPTRGCRETHTVPDYPGTAAPLHPAGRTPFFWLIRDYRGKLVEAAGQDPFGVARHLAGPEAHGPIQLRQTPAAPRVGLPGHPSSCSSPKGEGTLVKSHGPFPALRLQRQARAPPQRSFSPRAKGFTHLRELLVGDWPRSAREPAEILVFTASRGSENGYQCAHWLRPCSDSIFRDVCIP